MKNLITTAALALTIVAAPLATQAFAGETYEQSQTRIAMEQNLDTTATGSIPGADCDETTAGTSLACKITNGDRDASFPSAPIMVPYGF